MIRDPLTIILITIVTPLLIMPVHIYSTDQDCNTSMIMKTVKHTTIISVRNTCEPPLYSITINAEAEMDFVDARGWYQEVSEPHTVVLRTDLRPIAIDRPLIVILTMDKVDADITWSVADSLGNIIESEIITGCSSGQQMDEKNEDEHKPTSLVSVVVVRVLDEGTGLPIARATVVIAETSGKIVDWKITDRDGTSQLVIPKGDYYMRIKGSCCYSFTDRLSVDGDMEKTFELVNGGGPRY